MAKRRREEVERQVSDQEAMLFERAMTDVEHTPRLSPSPPASRPGSPRSAAIEPGGASPKQVPLSDRKPVVEHAPTAPRPAQPDRRGTASGVDRRTAQRLVRGQMSIDGRIDLHGMTQAQARRALDRFLSDAAAAGKRCVLVITGKGSAREPDGGAMPDRDVGVLRRSLPQWLALPSLGDKVVAYHVAKPRHGGEGAFYVLLRRRRS